MDSQIQMCSQDTTVVLAIEDYRELRQIEAHNYYNRHRVTLISIFGILVAGRCDES